MYAMLSNHSFPGMCLLYLLCILSLHVGFGLAAVKGRLCISTDAELTKCQAMKDAFDGENLKQLGCIRAENRYECMRLVRNGDAELLHVDDTDIYAAGKYYGLVPIVKESTSTDPSTGEYLYKAVVIIRADGPISNLDGLYQRHSCHTGVGRTVGWTVPVANLQARGVMTVKDCDNPVISVADFFGGSCAPEAFLPANDVNGNNPPKICDRCLNKDCPSSEYYLGYNGTVQCLIDQQGDVAFAKHSTIGTLAQNDHSLVKEDFRLLCPDNSVKTVDEWDQCSWATRPTGAIVTRPSLPASTISDLRSLLEQGSRRFNTDNTGFNMFASVGGKNLIFNDNTKQLRSISNANYTSYLGSYGPGYLHTMTHYISCPYTDRWCVVSVAEQHKCTQLSAALSASRITDKMECIVATSHKECMEKIESGQADLVTLDGGDVYEAGKSHNLVPIMAENYGGAEGTSYWAVAVVKKTNTNVNINNLRGKKSCHTGIQKTSGWNIPIGTLLEDGIISATTKCGIISSVGKLFSKSCVPGALDNKYDPTGTNPGNLCELCGGKSFCQRNSENKYYSYKGALRCLVEQNADVAFIKHSTVIDYTDGKLDEDWARNLKSADFELLCRDGTRKSVDQWESCSLAKVPSHAVVTKGLKSQRERSHYITILKKAQVQFGSNSTVFNMFSTLGGQDAMFDDSTQSLSEIYGAEKQNYQNFLGTAYIQAIVAMDKTPCTSSAAVFAPVVLYLVLLFSIL